MAYCGGCYGRQAETGNPNSEILRFHPMLSLAVLILFLSSQSDEVTISANHKERDGAVWRATDPNRVVVTYQDMRVETGLITYNDETQDLTAEDRVLFTRGPERVEGERLSMNVATKAGSLFNAKGTMGPGFYFTAEEAQRFEDGHYELHNATVTTCDADQTCDADRPAWTFATARAKIIPGKSMSATKPIFRMQGVPLFYLPYIRTPTEDRERSSGFLIPSTATSTTKGRTVRESFYYAINRSADALFSGEYLSKRGVAGEIEFRAVPNANSGTTIDTFFVRDKLGQGGHSTRIRSSTDLGHGVRGVVEMDLVSSFIFRQVFGDGFNIISNPIEDSRAYLIRNQPRLSYSFLYDRRGIFFPDQPTAVTQKLPSFEALLPSNLIASSPVYFNMETSFSGISRHDATIKTPDFVERFDAHPTFEIPVLRGGVFDWSHRIGVRETFYGARLEPANSSDPLNRFSLDYSTQFVGPQLQRDFGKFRHIVEPSVEYRYVTGADRFRDTIVTDDVDLITNTSSVEYALTNRFLSSFEFFSWRIAQQYFFDPTFGGAVRPGQRNAFAPLLDLTGFSFADGRRRFSPIVSTMRISTSPGATTSFQIDYDTERHRFGGAGLLGGFNHGQIAGDLSLLFRRSNLTQVASNQFRGTLRYGNEQKRGASAAFSAAYDIEHSVFQGSIAQVSYNWDCYGVSLEFMQVNFGARQESRIRFAFTLKNVGTYGTLRRQERLF